jgi:NADPH2:quinone reductase
VSGTKQKSNHMGYSAGRKTTIDVTDVIWKRARMAGFSLFAKPSR